ncbi:MAG: polyamine aminopropyltransferase [Lautropia sp.]
MQGLHLTADLYGCQCDPALLTDADPLTAFCRRAIGESGLTVVGEQFHSFDPGGVTGVVLLAESHLALHTWPELGGVTLDVYVCNFSTDNSGKAEALLESLIDAFAPRDRLINRIDRGAVDAASAPGQLVLEWLNPESAFGFRTTRELEYLRSKHQRIEVLETAQFGKLFRLDGRYMTSERDEFFYHETMVHPGALSHPAPRRALILGGGDGGSLEEVLKHPSIDHVDLVELDAEVIAVAKRHFASIHRGAFDDARVNVRIADGAAFVAESAAANAPRYDLIVLDLTDPDTVAASLYTDAFFRAAGERLAPQGVLSLHTGSPVYAPTQVRRLLATLQSVFPVVRPIGLFVPLYGSYWSIALCSRDRDPAAIDRRSIEAALADRGICDLRYYNAGIHHALFALPTFFAELLVPAREADPATRARAALTG